MKIKDRLANLKTKEWFLVGDGATNARVKTMKLWEELEAKRWTQLNKVRAQIAKIEGMGK